MFFKTFFVHATLKVSCGDFISNRKYPFYLAIFNLGYFSVIFDEAKSKLVQVVLNYSHVSIKYS